MRSDLAIASPLVTVLMPVYDGEAFLQEAIDSVLGQTFRDFELLVVDDGSTDDTAAILARVDDSRLRVVRNASNEGIVRALNHGLDIARGRFVARMDSDDISLPERLAKQVAHLERHPEIGAVGSWFVTLGCDHVVRKPTRPDDVRANMLFRCTLAHSSVMLRRAWFAAHGLRYDAEYPHAEDYEIWMRASKHFKIANLGEVLLCYRRHEGSVSRQNVREQAATVAKIHAKAFDQLGISATDVERRIHHWLTKRGPDGPEEHDPRLADIGTWLQKLVVANDARHLFPIRAFQRCIGRYWLDATTRKMPSDAAALPQFFGSPLAGHVDLRHRTRLRLGSFKRALLAAR